jgi:putative flippase GtrA
MRRLFAFHRRKGKFVIVGLVCFTVQFALLIIFARLGVAEPVANAIAFMLSAQLNFLMSARFTWADRGGRLRIRLAGYNATALLSLVANTAVFTAVLARTGTAVAAGLGVVSGMCVTYLVCDLLIFRRGRTADAR